MTEKGLNRGGAKGQQPEPGDESANVEKPGWQQEQGNLEKRKDELGRTGRNQGAQRLHQAYTSQVL